MDILLTLDADVPDHSEFLQDKLVICQRFTTDILVPIAQAYKASRVSSVGYQLNIISCPPR